MNINRYLKNIFQFANLKIYRIWNKLIVFFKAEWGGGPRDVMVKAMDCRILLSEFVLQSGYYVHIRTNTLGKGMILLNLPAMI